MRKLFMFRCPGEGEETAQTVAKETTDIAAEAEVEVTEDAPESDETEEAEG